MKNVLVIGFLIIMTILTTKITIPNPTIDSYGGSTVITHSTTQTPNTSTNQIDSTSSPSLQNSIADVVIASDIIIDSAASASVITSNSATNATTSSRQYDDDDDDEWEYEHDDEEEDD